MAETARRFRATLPALPDAADTVVGAAWDKDSSKFYDDDTGWSERGYAQGFAAGATWGAEWWAGHMAVCEFLSDLAVIHLMEMPTWHCVRRCLTVHARGCNCPENSEARRVSP